jgi:hypothetical protein
MVLLYSHPHIMTPRNAARLFSTSPTKETIIISVIVVVKQEEQGHKLSCRRQKRLLDQSSLLVALDQFPTTAFVLVGRRHFHRRTLLLVRCAKTIFEIVSLARQHESRCGLPAKLRALFTRSECSSSPNILPILCSTRHNTHERSHKSST